jgi:molecular chaperone GrpE
MDELKKPKNDVKISDTSSVRGDTDDLQRDLQTAIAQAEENLNGWKRTQADFENYRKRKDAESGEWVAFGKQAGVVQVLPVLDSLEQALLFAPDLPDEKYQTWKVGLMGIVAQIGATLKGMGIEKMETIGKKFDPNLHEAAREVPGHR